MKKTERTVLAISNIGYIAACVVLYLIAVCILVSAVLGIIDDITSGVYTVYRILDEVALIVFSVAVIDVGKYLMLEEVIKSGADDKSTKTPSDTLPKLAIIIASALSLEGLVLTIEVAKRDITQIFYPVSLLVTASLFIVAIGIYRNLSRDK